MSRVRRKHNKPIIGLTGGIGSGKTTVSAIFELLGSAVIDADRLAHEALADPDVITTLQSWWGKSIINPDGHVDRQAVGTIVFNHPEELARLERLLYPRIYRTLERLMEGYKVDPAVCAIVLDAPKLFEAGLHKICDVVVFVDADRSERLRRVMTQRGWTPEEFSQRENLQEPLDMKMANADHVVVNHSGTADIRPQVERILTSILSRLE